MKTVGEIESEYPLHWLVWNNEVELLKNKLKTDKVDKEKVDTRGRTPLMLAVKLSLEQCVKCLLAAKCDANYEHDGWSVVQEAICSGNADILSSVLEVRDLQRHVKRVTHVPKLLQHLLDAPDFYIEMKWEFTSWVPLMSRLCPSDVYKVYKRGANVRIDTTLLGFENNSWQRGNRTYIFKGEKESATMIEIDHDSNEVMSERMCGDIGDIVGIPLPVGAVQARLNAPVIINNIEMEKISFERNKCGIWGWRSEKCETVNGFLCKVYGASNVEFITKSRMDHLTDEQIKTKSARTPLHSFLGFTDEDFVSSASLTCLKDGSSVTENDKIEIDGNTDKTELFLSESTSGSVSPNLITAEEYFSEMDLKGRDIGTKKKITTKIQRFKANLWLSEEYPIMLQEQVLPILDLMSTMASPHVSKLKDFITMQLPAGFPVKIEIPLFHVLNACITFGNVFGMTTPVEHISTIKEDDRITCVVDDRCFDIPCNYIKKGSDTRRHIPIDDDDMLQYVIEQSLAEAKRDSYGPNSNDSDKVDIWEALRGYGVGEDTMTEEDAHLQRVLQESLCGTHREATTSPFSYCNENFTYMDADLAMAMRLSEQDQKQYEIAKQRDEEIMEEVIKLSLHEK